MVNRKNTKQRRCVELRQYRLTHWEFDPQIEEASELRWIRRLCSEICTEVRIICPASIPIPIPDLQL